MKRYTLLLLLIIITKVVFAQPQVFTVEHNGGTTIHNHLDSALNQAQNGDIIYLPGGVIKFSGTIRKGVTMIGAGFHLDSTIATGQTLLLNNLSVRGCSNFNMTGVWVQGYLHIDSCTNMQISRCRLGTNESDQVNIANSNNLIFSSSVVNTLMSGVVTLTNTVNNFVISNCLVYGILHGESLVLDNNIIFNAGKYGNFFHYPISYNYMVSNSVFKNNIILNNSTTYILDKGNLFYNNIFKDTATQVIGGAVSQNNNFNESINTVFQKVNSLTTYSTADNFNLANNSPAKGAGQNGIDCGIYGGNNPFKEGAVPLNPHIQAVNIAPNTDQNGNLNINIKVKAQKR